MGFIPGDFIYIYIYVYTLFFFLIMNSVVKTNGKVPSEHQHRKRDGG